MPPIVRPPQITPKLTAGGYVFPVYGPSSFTDTFGAFRGDVSGGWHHGDDIFAPLGAPILAVATGTVFSVGWNEIGGNRLWLRDGQGNLFYYAHLSAFSPLAVNGRRVDAGDVLGDAAELHEVLVEQRVHHAEQQEGIAAGPHRDVLGCHLHRLGPARVDHDDAPAPIDDRVQLLTDARRRQHGAVGDERVRADHQQEVGTREVGNRDDEWRAVEKGRRGEAIVHVL